MGATLLRTALKDTSGGACPGQASASAGTSAGTPGTWAAPVQPGILEMVVGFSFGPNNEIHSRIVLGEKIFLGNALSADASHNYLIQRIYQGKLSTIY